MSSIFAIQWFFLSIYFWFLFYLVPQVWVFLQRSLLRLAASLPHVNTKILLASRQAVKKMKRVAGIVKIVWSAHSSKEPDTMRLWERKKLSIIHHEWPKCYRLAADDPLGLRWRQLCLLLILAYPQWFNQKKQRQQAWGETKIRRYRAATWLDFKDWGRSALYVIL